MLYLILFYCVLGYVAYRIMKYAAPQMRTQAHLNRLVNGALPVQHGGWQPAYDFDSSMSDEFRLRQVNQLERVYESGYRVTPEGHWHA